MRILFLITGLHQGGAEAMLYKLLTNIDKSRFSCAVVSMLDEGVYGDKIISLGIPVYYLKMKKSNFLQGMMGFLRIVREFQPHLVQGWMYHANLFAFFAKLISPKIKISFNIRDALNNFRQTKVSTRYVIRLNAFLSRFSCAVINNSQVSQQQHLDMGFSKKRDVYIPNGFDTAKFFPNAVIYKELRIKLGLDENVKIVGNIARFHPSKNHFFMLDVFYQIKIQAKEPVYFILAGSGVDNKNIQLVAKIKELQLQDVCFLLGVVDSSQILPGLDVYLLTSLSEGFPNIVGEALASGVPCVVTDVGDCRLLVGEYGITCAIDSVTDLAEGACQYLLLNAAEKKKWQHNAHLYINKNFCITEIAKQYEKLYGTLVPVV